VNRCAHRQPLRSAHSADPYGSLVLDVQGTRVPATVVGWPIASGWQEQGEVVSSSPTSRGSEPHSTPTVPESAPQPRCVAASNRPRPRCCESRSRVLHPSTRASRVSDPGRARLGSASPAGSRSRSGRLHAGSRSRSRCSACGSPSSPSCRDERGELFDLERAGRVAAHSCDLAEKCELAPRSCSASPSSPEQSSLGALATSRRGWSASSAGTAPPSAAQSTSAGARRWCSRGVASGGRDRRRADDSPRVRGAARAIVVEPRVTVAVE